MNCGNHWEPGQCVKEEHLPYPESDQIWYIARVGGFSMLRMDSSYIALGWQESSCGWGNPVEIFLDPANNVVHTSCPRFIPSSKCNSVNQ